MQERYVIQYNEGRTPALFFDRTILGRVITKDDQFFISIRQSDNSFNLQDTPYESELDAVNKLYSIRKTIPR